jgi:hypothetical protein
MRMIYLLSMGKPGFMTCSLISWDQSETNLTGTEIRMIIKCSCFHKIVDISVFYVITTKDLRLSNL